MSTLTEQWVEVQIKTTVRVFSSDEHGVNENRTVELELRERLPDSATLAPALERYRQIVLEAATPKDGLR